MTEWAARRKEMVEQQIVGRHVTDPATIAALLTVPRELFVPDDERPYAYEDRPLPIGEGQTISQPYIVALMTVAAELDSAATVLEIGTGSGYQAAILSRIVHKVYTIERIPSLAEGAKRCFQTIGYTNIEARIGDGSLGWPEAGPFDAILVTAGAPVTPPPLIQQLKIGGRLIIPVGSTSDQILTRYRRLPDRIQEEPLIPVRFVPLI